MKSLRVATITDKSPIQKKVYEIRKRDDGMYELNMIMPSSYSFGLFNTPAECKVKASTMCPLGIKVNKI